MFRKVRTVFIILFCLLIFSAPVFAKTISNIPTYTDNENLQDYRTWAYPVYSSLVIRPDGFERVEMERIDGKPVILSTLFDQDFVPKSEKIIDLELPLFGGFYNGNDYYFLVVGQSNNNEDDNCEVIRIIKYDKNWNRLGQTSIRGANTYIPFDAGSVRMADYNNNLFIRTSHEMYQSSDGLHHQANLPIQISIPDMSLVDIYYNVMNSGVGYVSHSFNQFVIVDNGDIVNLDHGDAYPRGALLGRYNKKAGPDGFTGYYISEKIISYAGETGENTTNATVGGLEASKNNYLTVGSSTPQTSFNQPVQNVYLSITPKDQLGESKTSLKWLTNLDNNSNITCGTPQLVKINDDSFLITWNQQSKEYPYSSENYYVFVDGNGNLKNEVTKLDAKLSDCKPVVKDGTAYWYISNKSNGTPSIILYSLDQNGKLVEREVNPEIPVENMTISPETINFNIKTGPTEQKLEVSLTPVNTTDVVTFLSLNPDVAEVDSTGTVKAISVGSTSIKVKAGNIEKQVSVTVNDFQKVPLFRVYNPNTGEHLYTTTEAEANSLAHVGWVIEPGGWDSPNTGDPVYRVYNPNAPGGDHHYTKDKAEADMLDAIGWSRKFYYKRKN